MGAEDADVPEEGSNEVYHDSSAVYAPDFYGPVDGDRKLNINKDDVWDGDRKLIINDDDNDEYYDDDEDYNEDEDYDYGDNDYDYGDDDYDDDATENTNE